MPHTVLYVPVPALEPYIRWRHEEEGPEWLSPDPGHTHAHVTLLGPFAPEAELTVELDAGLGAFFAAVPAFGFFLEDIRVFPTGLVYLHPEPAEGFAELTDALAARYPAYPPYAGEFPPVPHLSLCALGPERDLELVRGELGDLLPVKARAEEVRLVRYEAHRTTTIRAYPLGDGSVFSGPAAREP